MQKSQGAFPFDSLETLAKCQLEALAEAHEQMAHLDVNPRNMSQKHLLDFGSAQPQQQETVATTRPYRAPEVLLNKVYGTKADLWSLGVTLFNLYFD